MPETTGNGRQDQGAKRRRIASSNSKGAKKLSAGQSKALKAPSAVQPAKGSSQAIIDKAVFKPLPKKYSLSPTSEWERLIVIGDVHGMIEALEALLKCIGFKSESDHLIFVGDMITKGRKTEPSDSKRSSEEVAIEASKDVLKFAIEHEASAVLGNHEDIILNAGKKGYKESLKRTLDGEFKEKKYLRTSKESEKALDKALYNALSRKEKSWLEELPHVLDLGKVGGRDKMVVVHAGLNPTLGLKEQIALETMNLKTIDPSGSTSSMHKGDKEVEKYLKSDEDKQLFAQMVPWFQAWDNKQTKLEANQKETTTVIYGHESKLGLTKRKFSIGLDTGVQRIDKDPTKYRTLTALVIYHDRCQIVQVKEILGKDGKWKWQRWGSKDDSSY